MAILKYVATHISQRATYSENITDLQLIDTDRGTVLVAVSNKGTGLTSYMLNGADLPAAGASREPSISYGTYYSAPKLEVIARAGDSYQLVITGQQGSVHTGLTMGGDGNLLNFTSLFSASQLPGNVVAMNIFQVGGQDYVLSGTDGSMALTLYRMQDDLSLSRLGADAPGGRVSVDAEYTDIEVMQLGTRTFAYAASAQGNMLTIYEVGAGGITHRSTIAGNNTIGISAPREVEAVTAANGRFLIITGGESDSLTVFKVSSSGSLSVADHVVDSQLTRFEAATAIATVELGGRAYIFVGGADDGISIFILDGQGRLILLDVLADSTALALADISAIEAKAVGGKIAIFVASATETGITQLSYDPGPIGRSLVGAGSVSGTQQGDILVGTGAASSLKGGQGDDILIARSGVVTMQGGSGRDVFVPGHDTDLVTIVDFHPGYDRLDLSELAYIRSIAQLKIMTTATGALLVAGEVRIEIQTITGKPLPASIFTDEMFRLAHYANDIDYSELVTPVTPDPGTPSTSLPPTPSPGGYVGPVALPAKPSFSKAISGTNGADRLSAPAKGALIKGLGGDDRIAGAASAKNLLDGGTGKDTLSGGNSTDYLYGGDGNDSLMGGKGHDYLNGGNGDDVIIGGAGDDRIYGGSGRNVLVGHDGNDLIIVTGRGGNLIRGDNGSDDLRGVGRDSISGGAGHDRISASGNSNRIQGNDGNDLIRVTGSDNVLAGGTGNDTLCGGIGRDSLYGEGGDDLFYGGGGNDLMFGHAGNDRIFGQAGDDRMRGMLDNDVIVGGAGNDGAWGDEGDDRILGQHGNDTIYGGDGRDVLQGDEGDDRIYGGVGDDRLAGGAGADFVAGQDGHDALAGGDGNDHLDGGAGRDRLDGGKDNDRLMGGLGEDVLHGGSGRDSLRGDRDNDTLYGGAGNDTMTGGLGEDVFIFEPSSGSGIETDRITDFQSGADVIDLSGLARSLVWMDKAQFTGTGRAEVRFQGYSDRTRLLVDKDGDGDVDLVIDVYGDAVSPFDLLY